MKRVYLDHNATTPVKPQVIQKMSEVMTRGGNASAIHALGREARRDVEQAREAVAALCKVNANQVIFTSGATESNNMIMSSFAGQRIVSCMTEHPSVAAFVEDKDMVPVDDSGLIDMEALDRILSEGEPPALFSLMLVNNETGVIQPVEDVARHVKAKYPGIYVHTDAVQAAGRVAIDFGALQVDYLSLSAHKMGGPQGIGALVFAPGTEPKPLMRGGGQEKRLRAGTENVPAIAGFGVAAELAVTEMPDYQKLDILRDEMEAKLMHHAPDIKIWGLGAPRVSNTMSLCFTDMPAKSQMMNLDLENIGVSSGSACSSGSGKVSRVLTAMGASEDEAKSTLRVSLGWTTSQQDVDHFVESWIKICDRARSKQTVRA